MKDGAAYYRTNAFIIISLYWVEISHQNLDWFSSERNNSTAYLLCSWKEWYNNYLNKKVNYNYFFNVPVDCDVYYIWSLFDY
jgi:hypothetical protein